MELAGRYTNLHGEIHFYRNNKRSFKYDFSNVTYSRAVIKKPVELVQAYIRIKHFSQQAVWA